MRGHDERNTLDGQEADAMATATPTRPHPGLLDAATPRTLSLVWIDAREAIVVRWIDGAPVLRQIESDVPPHHRATGHVRHDPGIRHGGGGVPQTAGEPHRLEHLARFLDATTDALPAEGDLLVLGPGTVREHLAQLVREHDRQNRVARVVSCEAAARLSQRQLVERLRVAIGEEPRRRTVGAHRWSVVPKREASGRRSVERRRLVEKPRDLRPDDRQEG
jgi:hypothetical protein